MSFVLFQVGDFINRRRTLEACNPDVLKQGHEFYDKPLILRRPPVSFNANNKVHRLLRPGVENDGGCGEQRARGVEHTHDQIRTLLSGTAELSGGVRYLIAPIFIACCLVQLVLAAQIFIKGAHHATNERTAISQPNLPFNDKLLQRVFQFTCGLRFRLQRIPQRANEFSSGLINHARGW